MALTALRLTGVHILVIILSSTVAALAKPSIDLRRYVVTSWDDSFLESVLDITQDRDGYIWLATASGPVRFDGLRFVPFSDVAGSTEDDRPVSALAATRDGSLWFGHLGSGGVTRFARGETVRYSPGEGGLVAGAVLALQEDREGALWAGARDGVSRWFGGQWARIGTDQGLPEAVVYDIFEDRQGQMWIATAEGLFRWSTRERQFTRYLDVPMRSLREDGEGRLWAATADGSLLLLAESPDRARDVGRFADVRRILSDRDGSIWITSADGLYRVRDGEGAVTHVVEHLGRPQGLAHEVTRSLFEDREGNLWVGSAVGLTCLVVGTIEMLPAEREGFPTGAVATAIGTPDGNVWAGTAAGLYVFKEGATATYVRVQEVSNPVGPMHVDVEGNLWVATSDGIMRRSGSRWERVPLPEDLPFAEVSAITTGADGRVYVGTRLPGVLTWDPDEGSRVSVIPELHRSVGVQSAITDRSGRVWLGFADGVVATIHDGRVEVFSASDGLVGDRAATLLEDRRGHIWIGTTEGLVVFKSGRFTARTSACGIPLRNVTSLLEDERERLWVANGSGLLRLDPGWDSEAEDGFRPTACRLYDESDGISGRLRNWIAFPSATRTRDGRLVFVTTEGLAVVDPGAATPPRLPPSVRIERVLADREELNSGVDFSVPPNPRTLQIDYTALSFRAPQRVAFRYMLDGVDTDWIDAGTRRQVVYTGLGPGAYRFRVVAASDGVWNEDGATWAFSVLPAFYQTWWFYTLCWTAVFVAAAGAWRLHVSQVRRNFALIAAERGRLAREIHDTLLQGLLGLALQFDDVAAKVDSSPAVAKEQLQRLRQLAEQYARDTRESIWALRSPTLESRNLPSTLRAHCESIAAQSAVGFDLRVVGTVRRVAADVEEQVLRICVEAVTNAVRHGQPNHVQVELRYTPDQLHVRVLDNGRGFDVASTGSDSHWGLLSMRERAQLIGAKLVVGSRTGFGTEVKIDVPLTP